MTDSCPICDSHGDPFQRYEREGERWTGLTCRACATQYWYPRVIRPGFYADPHQETYERRRGGESFLRPRHRMFLERARPGRLLDIGCGEGSFIAAARAKGFDVAGIDLDPGSIAVAAGRGLANVRATQLFDSATGVVDSVVRDSGPYDWVTAFEVLEHQAAPIAFLRAVKALLVPGGTFCGSVPNRDRLFASRQRKVNSGDFPPHHFLWFSAKTLEHTLATAGFGSIQVLAVPEDELMPYASYLEDALLGTFTKKAKKRVHAITNGKAAKRNSAVTRAIRTVKNLPFVPLAQLVRRTMPMRLRSLYFEARA